MSEETWGEWLKRLNEAATCCGTCFGGVLADRITPAKSAAWDEGHKRGYKDGYDDNGNGYDAGDDNYVPQGNPYRKASA